MAKKKDDKSKEKEDAVLDTDIDALQKDLNDMFGADTVQRLDHTSILSKIQHWVPTGSVIIDSVLRGTRPEGASLVPFGRQMEVSGLENTGKTTLCAQIAAQVQAMDGLVIVTDTEERIDHAYWTMLGVDCTRIMHISCKSVKDVFNKQYGILNKLKNDKKWKDKKVLMIWDSVGGTAPEDQVNPDSKKETPMDQIASAYGRAAAELSSGIKLINSIVSQTKACYLYTNHLYHKMDTMGYGDKMETYGGQKLKYYATVRLRLKRIGAIKEPDPVSTKDMIIGSRILVSAQKNSMAPVLLEREAALIGGKGFCDAYTIFEQGVKLGVLTRKGSWSKWITPAGDEVSFQGFNGFSEKVMPHKEYPVLVSAVNNLL